MKDNLYRIVFMLLFVVCVFVFGCDLIHAQPNPEGAMGTFSLPDTVGMSGQEKNPPPPISIDVFPKVVISNPYARYTFRVRWKVANHRDNRRWSYAATCGAEEKASSREILYFETDEPDAFTSFTRHEELTVVYHCFFQACVHRVTKGKAVTYCAKQEVATTEQEVADGRRIYSPLPVLQKMVDGYF